MESTDLPWYRDGLAFTCTRCGDCCTGAPGYVWVDEEEIRQLAEYRGEPVDRFGQRFLRQVGDRYSLIEKPDGDCVFYDRTAGGCSVYPARPRQCRTWPFWPQNLASPEAWRETCQVCPGSGRGRHHPLVEIQAKVQGTAS